MNRNGFAKIGVIFLLVGLTAMISACGSTAYAETDFGGNVEKGKAAIAGYGCGACHVIPGVRGARGNVGPPLSGIASRAVIAGRLPNNPENMVEWIMHPQQVSPGSDMPELGVNEVAARDIATYLSTLR